MHKDLIAKILGVTVKSVYNYEKEKRIVLQILNNYMTDKDAIELIETGKISKFEKSSLVDENELLEKHIAYELKHKLYIDTQSKFLNWLGTMAGMGLIEKSIFDIQNDTYSKADTKEKILNQIRGMELSDMFDKIWGEGRKKVASSYIENNLSELECYVWVKYYDIVKSYTKYF